MAANELGILIKSSNGFDYLAIDILEEQYKKYSDFMLSQNLHEEIALKLKRDNCQYHITLMNVAEWGSLGKKDLQVPILNEVLDKDFSFIVGGIGMAEKAENKTFFVIADNSYLHNLRNEYGLGKHDFHMTLAFKEKDVFGVCKSNESCIFSNAAIHEFNQKKSIINSKVK